MEEEGAREVERFYRFIAEWVRGDFENTDEVFDERCAGRLSLDFSSVQAEGTAINRGQFLGIIRHLWGVNPGFEFEVREVRARQLGPEAVLVTFEAWQFNLPSPHIDGCRVSSALLRSDPDSPDRLQWVHVHQSWAR